MKRLLPFLVLALAGCGGDTPEARATNKVMLSSAGDYIGTLPDGRRVMRYELISPDSSYSHWVYVTDGSITVNRKIPAGKATRSGVEVIIDGVTYAPKTP